MGDAVKKSGYNLDFPAGAITINGSGELAAENYPFCRRAPETLDLLSNRMQDTPEQWDEARLLKEIRAGDRAAWDEFLRRYGALLWMITKKYARFIRRPEMAEDIFQEICVHVIKNSHKWKPNGEFRNYLSRMARLKAIDVIRKIIREQSRIDSIDDPEKPLATPAPAPDAEAQITRQEQIEGLNQCIEGLPPKQRQAIKAMLAELSPKEAAKEMGITVNHWRVLVYRAENSLKDCMNGKKRWTAKTAGEER